MKNMLLKKKTTRWIKNDTCVIVDFFSCILYISKCLHCTGQGHLDLGSTVCSAYRNVSPSSVSYHKCISVTVNEPHC